jgi:uncharacterized surface protein with fasciclin (FAS1) repeats
MKSNYLTNFKKTALSVAVLFSTFAASAQTNVFDNVIATSPNHTSLTAAINAAGLSTALRNNAATLTVFAPDNDAFTALAADLGVTIPALLALPNLSDILLYHVLGTTASSSSITNGMLVTPLNTANTIKLTLAGGDVYANQAKVNAADLTAANGVVHSVNSVLSPNLTVVDIAIGNASFTSLVAALIKAELLPALTNPYVDFTVFAPTNTAFTNLATALGTDINGILALPNLPNILLYHVVSGTVLSTDLTNGPVTTLNGGDVIVDLTNGVKINTSTVTTADLLATNGVVHVIDAVLVPTTTSVKSINADLVKMYPNPTSKILNITNPENEFICVKIVDAQGKIVLESDLNGELTQLDVRELKSGNYIVHIEGTDSMVSKSLLISSQK